jgi:hypothetical protein
MSLEFKSADRIHIQNVIERIEFERSCHEEKFKGNTVHKDCLPRFDQTLSRLQEELAKLATTQV